MNLKDLTPDELELSRKLENEGLGLPERIEAGLRLTYGLLQKENKHWQDEGLLEGLGDPIHRSEGGDSREEYDESRQKAEEELVTHYNPIKDKLVYMSQLIRNDREGKDDERSQEELEQDPIYQREWSINQSLLCMSKFFFDPISALQILQPLIPPDYAEDEQPPRPPSLPPSLGDETQGLGAWPDEPFISRN